MRARTDANIPDEQLLERWLAGQADALGELAHRYETGLLGLARGLLGGRKDLACDAVQETWLRALRFGSQFNGRCRVKTWLYRIAINQCHNLREAAGRRPFRPLSEKTEPAAGDAGSGAMTSRGAEPPEKAAERSERDDALRRAVEALPEEQRLAILLCYHEGLKHDEAAEVLAVPLGTLKSRLHAALEALRRQLGSNDVSAFE